MNRSVSSRLGRAREWGGVMFGIGDESIFYIFHQALPNKHSLVLREISEITLIYDHLVLSLSSKNENVQFLLTSTFMNRFPKAI